MEIHSRDPEHAPVEYPESDGNPMAETDLHRDEALALIWTLSERYASRRDVYVSGNIFVYYEQGVPSSVFSPDVLVVLGVEKKKRRTYKLWEEGGTAPAVIFELSSRKTWTEDLGEKKVIAEHLGVREYFLIDPEHDYLDPPVQGWILRGKRYEPMPAGDGLRVTSEVLGLEIALEGAEVRLRDLATGRVLHRPEGMVARLDSEALRAKRESVRIVLVARGLATTTADLSRLDACSDHSTLERWLARAATASSAAEALRDQ